MVQTVCTKLLLVGEKAIILEKPNILHRIFFSIRVVAGEAAWRDTKLSFDDPAFLSYYSLNGSRKSLEARGADIFQGNIWVMNQSEVGLLFTATEILH